MCVVGLVSRQQPSWRNNREGFRRGCFLLNVWKGPLTAAAGMYSSLSLTAPASPSCYSTSSSTVVLGSRDAAVPLSHHINCSLLVPDHTSKYDAPEKIRRTA